MTGQFSTHIQRKRPTIIDNLILPTDHIHINQRQVTLDHTINRSDHAVIILARVKRRGIQRNDQISARLHQTLNNIGFPNIFTDW